MFLIKRALVPFIDDIKKEQIVTMYDQSLCLGYTDNPSQTTYEDIYDNIADMFIVENTDDDTMVALIAGKRDFLDPGNKTLLDGYRITFFVFDIAALSVYDKGSCYNMATQLLRNFCADKNAFNIFIPYDIKNKDVVINDYVLHALKNNEFVQASFKYDSKTQYYLRTPVLTTFKGYYN